MNFQGMAAKAIFCYKKGKLENYSLLFEPRKFPGRLTGEGRQYQLVLQKNCCYSNANDLP